MKALREVFRVSELSLWVHDGANNACESDTKDLMSLQFVFDSEMKKLIENGTRQFATEGRKNVSIDGYINHCTFAHSTPGTSGIVTGRGCILHIFHNLQRVCSISYKKCGELSGRLNGCT